MVDLEGLNADARHPSYEELSQLTLDAAIELDRRQRGETVDQQVIDSLIEYLGLRSETMETGEALRCMVDPRTVDVYNRALHHLTRAKISTIDELADKIGSYLEAFSENLDTAKPESISAMRDFCLAIHRELLAETFDRYSDIAVEAR